VGASAGALKCFGRSNPLHPAGRLPLRRDQTLLPAERMCDAEGKKWPMKRTPYMGDDRKVGRAEALQQGARRVDVGVYSIRYNFDERRRKRVIVSQECALARNHVEPPRYALPCRVLPFRKRAGGVVVEVRKELAVKGERSCTDTVAHHNDGASDICGGSGGCQSCRT